jgi:hypothetical protein
MNTHHLSRTTLGIPGLLGALLLLTWVVGWAAFGMHARGFHLLVPVGALLLLVQGVRRVNSADDD